MRSLPRLCVFALLVFFIVGCNEVTAPPDTVQLALLVKAWDPEPSNQVALAGVQICEFDTTNCQETDSGGNATLELPLGPTAYTMDKEGYASVLWAEVIPYSDWPPSRVAMFPDQYAADEHERVMSDYPMRGTGTIEFRVFPGRAGVTFDLENASGTQFYTDEDFHWRTDLTATTSLSTGGFTNVTAPGEYQIRITETDLHCVATQALSWPGDAENKFRVPVREGYITQATAGCPL